MMRAATLISYSYTDDMWNLLITEPFQADAVPRLQDPYSIVDVRVGWEFSNSNYGFELYATNLTDEEPKFLLIRVTMIRESPQIGLERSASELKRD